MEDSIALIDLIAKAIPDERRKRTGMTRYRLMAHGRCGDQYGGARAAYEDHDGVDRLIAD
ncbi:unnamed protein product [Dovyalis caffra]|uniref:Uncharacterized protein n=1 Tax=Dovyalis caffra TaxID=77055 RepID=A0AAV1SM91_9ROSI|nr:unnamed protein product [Dovyalis caffra]